MKVYKLAGIIAGVVVALIVAAVAIAVAMFNPAQIKGEVSKSVHDKTGRTLTIEGNLGLSFWPNVGVTVGKTQLSEFHGAQEFAGFDHARVSVAVLPLLSKRIVVDAIELDGAHATLVKHADGTLNIANLTAKKEGGGEAGTATSAGPGTPVQIDVAAIKIHDARLTWRDEQSGQTTTVSGFDFATGHVTGNTGTQAYEVDNLSLALAGASGDKHAALNLAIPKVVLAPDKARTLTVDKIDGNIELASPQMPMKSVKLPLSGQLKAQLENEAAEGTLSTRLDESNIALKFEVAKFSPLALGFDLNVDRLDVDKYLPPPKPAAAAQPAAAKHAPEEDKIDLSALKGLNIHGGVRVGQLEAHNVKASNVRLAIKALDGRLDIAPHTMDLYQGKLAGSLSVEATGNAITLREDLSGISINPLMKDAIDKDLLEGRGDVRLDLSTHGETVTAMKHALGGSASLALRDGAIKGINLAQSFREAKALLSGNQDAVQQARASDKTDFSEMSASFRIAAGIAHNDDLAVKSPFLRLGGTGDIDIGRGTMDYVAKASVVGTSGGQGGKELEQLQGVTIPVRATGPFDKLAYRIEYGAIAEGALKARVDEKKQQLKQELKQKARDELLKGLLGK